jgi:hypothetical protein
MGRIQLFLAALWWGSLTTICFLVVPLLFANLASAAQAGAMAAVLFSAQTWICVFCGVSLIIAARRKSQEDSLFSRANVRVSPSGWIVAGMLSALLLEFAVAPRILSRVDLQLWHSIGSALLLVQWICATGFLWRLYTKMSRQR